MLASTVSTGLVLFGAACGDPCETLCTTVSDELEACMDNWPFDWADLDATGRRNFERRCKNEWQSTQSELEPRELGDALDQCREASVAIVEEPDTCQRLRALYVE